MSKTSMPEKPIAIESQREPSVMSVGSAAVWAMAAHYIGFIIYFITSVIISRFFLAPEEVGLFSIAMAAALLLAVLQDFGLTRYISGLPKLDDENIRRCSSVVLLFSLFVTALIMAAAKPIALIYQLPALASLLMIIAGSYLFLPLSVVPLAIMARSMRFTGHFVVHVSGAVIHAAVALCLAALDFSAFALAWATLASAACKGIIAQLLQTALPIPIKLDRLKPIMGFGGKTSMLYVVGALGTRTPDMIIGKLVNLFAVGLFTRATGLAEQFRMLISGAIGGVFYPAFARIRDRGDPMGPPYLRVCAAHGAIILPGMIALSVAAEPIVLMLYGEQWAGTATLLSLIAVQSGVMFCLPLVTELPILTGQINRLILLNIAETIISVGLLMIGSYWGGVEGAAASRIVYALCFYALYIRFISGVVVFHIFDWCKIMGQSLIVTLATITPLLLAYGFWIEPSQMGFGPLLLCTIAGGASWAVSMIFIRHPALADFLNIIAPALNRLSPRLNGLITKYNTSSGESA